MLGLELATCGSETSVPHHGSHNFWTEMDKQKFRQKKLTLLFFRRLGNNDTIRVIKTANLTNLTKTTTLA